MLPLVKVSFEQYITFDEISTTRIFPPPRFAARNTHLQNLDDIYESDFRKFVAQSDQDLVAIPSGLSGAIIDDFVNIMLMSEPECEYPLRQVAADAVRDMLTYGGAVVLSVFPIEGTPYLRIISPDCWYPAEDREGLIIFEPFTSVSATNPTPDRARITVLENGRLEERTVIWSGASGTGTIGDTLSTETIGAAQAFYSPRSPANGIWGESLFMSLAGPLFEITKRVSQNSRVLDKNVNPLLMYSAATGDAIEEFSDDTKDAEEQQNDIIKGIEQLRKGDAAHINDNIQKLEYLEYTGNMGASMEQLKMARELISNMTGLPGVFESLGNAPASGRALMLQFIKFFANTSTLQKDLTEVLEMAVNAILPGATVVWPHVFETFEEVADTTEVMTDVGPQGATQV